MRARWGRADAPLAFDASVLTALIQPAFPDQVVVRSTLAVGGLANTNFRLDLSVHPAPVLLRLYTRERAVFEREAPFEKEAALLRLVAPSVPVPRMFFAAAENA